MWVAAVLIPIQIAVGNLHGVNAYEHQPAKLEAMEGVWDTQRGVPSVLFALPDEATQSNRYEVAIPKLASLYLGHSFDAEVQGLKDFPGEHPSVAPAFFAFRIMVGVVGLMLLVSWAALWQMRRRGRPGPWTARALVAMPFSGLVALVAGWYITEIGRQPWLVHVVLKTADAASAVPAGDIQTTLVMYLLLYAVLLVSFISVLFHLADKARVDPQAKDMNPRADPFRAGNEAREGGHA